MQIISRSEAKSQNLTRYYNGKPCKHGHIAERSTKSGSCFECRSISKRGKTLSKILQHDGVTTRSEALNMGELTYFTGKLCKHGHLSVRYVSTSICKECCRVNSSKRRKSHPDYMKGYLERYKDRRNDRPSNDVNYRCLLRMRCMLRRLMNSTNTRKNNNTVIEVGYGPSELKAHLESLFTTGMSWDNYGEWHIDHIIPLSKLISSGFTDPKLVNGLWNLQPLWAEDNLSKSDKI